MSILFSLTLLGLLLFLWLLLAFSTNSFWTPNNISNLLRQGAMTAILAVGQTFVIITAGIDLSVGMILTLTNCLASWVLAGTGFELAFGVMGVLGAGLLCGMLNGLIVVFGRLQPIVATIATSAIFYGLALLLRPTPGGSINEDLADFFTSKLFGLVPASLAFLALVVLLVWIPYSRSVLGRTAYAIGSAEQAAYMSSMPVRKAKFAAYAISGFMAGIGGLYLTFFSYTGEAALASGNAYTLFSIAAIVLGGVSLAGGRGSAIGAVFGALAFRAIGDLLFVFDLDPLWQPLFQGVVLILAIAIGSIGFARVRNRLEWFQ
uniref:ABC transporter permease n=1 Tax=uncultured Rhizobium sp. TaxID=155567 RepID=UPI0026069115|nr:ABC transporter permease [uncultured Rhizobium sp.]